MPCVFLLAAVLICWAVDARDEWKMPKPEGKKRDWEYPERIHNPERFKPPPPEFVNESDYTIHVDTPDWRVEEPPVVAIHDYFKEHHRPFRQTPFDKQASRWNSAHGWFRSNLDKIWNMGCYCCTVFKRLTPLGTCAVITTRHILTSATSTELILKEYGKNAHLENILGAWYDRDGSTFNSSMYMTPARIHYHPRYTMPDSVNVSHPLPCLNDLAVWAATHPFVGSAWSNPNAYVCQRAGSFWLSRGSPVLGVSNVEAVAFVIGFQFMWAYKRVPAPWFRYAIKTMSYLPVCPKNEWGWFFCLQARFAQLGIDSGCVLHRSNQRNSWMYDGLLGIGSFSMSLRAPMLTHYFTPVENYDVLEWLYKAYMGRQKYRYLDGRFYDTQWKAPYPKPWFFIHWNYALGDEHYYDDPPEWNK